MSKVVKLTPRQPTVTPTREELIAEHFSEKWVSTYDLLSGLDWDLKDTKVPPNLVFQGGPDPIVDMENGVTVYSIVDPDHVQGNIVARTTLGCFRKDTAVLALELGGEKAKTLRYFRDLVEGLCKEFRLVNYELNARHGVVWLDRAYPEAPVTYRHVVRVELWRDVDMTLRA